MKKTFTTLLLTLLFITLLSTTPTTSQAQPLVVTVDGVNVNLDWSAMPTATSYTLYYALADYNRLVVESMEGVRDEMIEKKLAEYDRLCLPQCQLQISANGIHVNIPEKGNITLVSSCPIPSGAKCIEHGRTQSYVLNGHYVGPFTTWHSSGRQQASSIFCYDANGTKSWFISFNENDDDKAKYFAEFRNGDDMPSIEYHFYPNGCLKYSKYPDKSYYYSKNGTLLEECDFKQQSCTKYEGWTPRF